MVDPARTTPTFRQSEPFADFDFFGPSLFRRRVGEPPDGPARMARPDLALPAIDVSESDNQYVATVELPGSKAEDVNVDVLEGVLTIRGEKRSERSEENEQSRWAERSFGSFSRSFRLPADADSAKIDAAFKHGVLTIEIAKTRDTKSQAVHIKS